MKTNLIFRLLLSLIPILLFPQSIQKIADIGDITLTNGKVIIECKIGYRTFGRMNDDKSNVIIYPSWFNGNSERLAYFIEKYNFIDTTKFFIIAIDALGNGISTSSSNYNGEFPQITIRDIVNSQHKLLTEHLGLNNIYAAVGGSMGSMQVLEWSIAYPEFIEKVAAYVASPKMTSFDLLWMNTNLEMIEELKEQGTSEREIKKISSMMTTILSRTPSYIVEHVEVENFQEYLSSFDTEPSKNYTLNDYIIHLKAMMMHDITKDFGNSMEVAAKAIKSDMFIIVSETDMILNPTEAIRLADILGCRKMILNNNCGHMAPSCELERVKAEIDEFLSGS